MSESEVRETIGCAAHRCANSRYAEGRFAVARNKLATLNAAKPGACPGKQGEETGRRDVALAAKHTDAQTAVTPRDVSLRQVTSWRL